MPLAERNLLVGRDVTADSCRRFHAPLRTEPFCAAAYRSAELREPHPPYRIGVRGRGLPPFRAGTEHVIHRAAPPFDGRFGVGVPDTVLIHRLFIDDDAVSRTVGYHFDTAAQFIAASGAQAPAAAAVGCGEGRLTGFEPGYGDVMNIEEIRVAEEKFRHSVGEKVPGRIG